jgi:hypothetical protein
MNIFLDSDLKVLDKKGITVANCLEQLNCFSTGFPFLQIKKAAEINDGILKVDTTQIDHYIEFWDDFLARKRKKSSNLFPHQELPVACSKIFLNFWMANRKYQPPHLKRNFSTK